MPATPMAPISPCSTARPTSKRLQPDMARLPPSDLTVLVTAPGAKPGAAVASTSSRAISRATPGTPGPGDRLDPIASWRRSGPRALGKKTFRARQAFSAAAISGVAVGRSAARSPAASASVPRRVC